MLSTGPCFAPSMKRVKTIHFNCLLGLLLLAGCSSIDRGVVVGKGRRFRPGASPPIDYYWVDVRGKNSGGEKVTERIELFQRDWNRFNEGDHISPHDYDLVGAVKKITRGKGTPTPKPAASKNRKDRPAARKKSPTPSPATENDKPQTEAGEEARFRSVESRAHGDATVRGLKLKIHDAKTDEEQAAAFQEYRRALFQRMREMEPSLKERIDQAEGAGGNQRF